MTQPADPLLEQNAALVGEKVLLARLRKEDVPDLVKHYQNLELTTYLGAFGMAFSQQNEEAYFEDVSKRHGAAVNFAVYDRATGLLIGGVDLREINYRQGSADLGVSIHNPEYWGGGYGREAVQLMVEYGVFFLGLHNIMLTVYSYNERGIRAYQKVGFREIGRRRGAVRLGNERFDVVLMDILASEVDTSRMRALIKLLPPK